MKKLDRIKKLVVVVDMVNGFVKFGNMADPYINHITPKIIEIIEKTLKEDEAIAFIADTHDENSTEYTKFPVHCKIGSREEEIIDELKRYLKHALYYIKNSTSAMYAPGLLNDIDAMKNLEEVVIVGCCTDICDLNFAIPLVCYFDQNNRKVKVTVYKDAVETYNAPNHNRDEYNEMAFKLMKQAGVNVL